MEGNCTREEGPGQLNIQLSLPTMTTGGGVPKVGGRAQELGRNWKTGETLGTEQNVKYTTINTKIKVPLETTSVENILSDRTLS